MNGKNAIKIINTVISAPMFIKNTEDLMPIFCAWWKGGKDTFLSIQYSNILGIILYEPIAVQYWDIVAGSGIVLKGKKESIWIVLIKAQAAEGLETIDKLKEEVLADWLAALDLVIIALNSGLT